IEPRQSTKTRQRSSMEDEDQERKSPNEYAIEPLCDQRTNNSHTICGNSAKIPDGGRRSPVVTGEDRW
ncbi:hypothetical protein U1Q18_022741, partial [Sarracenia purpurea var. burkii]